MQPTRLCSCYSKHTSKQAQKTLTWAHTGEKIQLKRTAESRGKVNKKVSVWPGYLITADVCTVMPANYLKHLSSSLCCNKLGGCLWRCERGCFNYLNHTASSLNNAVGRPGSAWLTLGVVRGKMFVLYMKLPPKKKQLDIWFFILEETDLPEVYGPTGARRTK